MDGAVVIDLSLEPAIFVDQLSEEIVTGGLTVVDAIERLLTERVETSIRQSLSGCLVKAPRSIVHPGYYLNRFENLAALAREGYSTWYLEVRFATRKSDSLKITDVGADGFDLGHVLYGDGVKCRYMYNEILSKVVDGVSSGGFLSDAIDERHAIDDLDDQLSPVQCSPLFLRGQRQLEDHR